VWGQPLLVIVGCLGLDYGFIGLHVLLSVQQLIQVLERVHCQDDWAHVSVYLITIVAGSQILHQRSIIELVNVHHVCETLHCVARKVQGLLYLTVEEGPRYLFDLALLPLLWSQAQANLLGTIILNSLTLHLSHKCKPLTYQVEWPQ